MKQFSIQLRTFKVKGRAEQEMQAFAISLSKQLMDEAGLRRFKVSLLRKQIEINRKYPRSNDLEMVFSPVAEDKQQYQWLKLKSNFLLIIRQSGNLSASQKTGL